MDKKELTIYIRSSSLSQINKYKRMIEVSDNSVRVRITEEAAELILWIPQGLREVPPESELSVVFLAESYEQAESIINNHPDFNPAALLMAGVSGPRLVAALKAAGERFKVIDPAFMRDSLAGRLFPGSPVSEEKIFLTPREDEIITCISMGMTNKMISGELAISERTVKFHISEIMKKLNCRSRTEILIRAIKLGFLSL